MTYSPSILLGRRRARKHEDPVEVPQRHGREVAARAQEQNGRQHPKEPPSAK